MGNNLIPTPKKIAICLFSSNKKTSEEQVNLLSPLLLDFEIEWWFKHQRNKGDYLSYSQMVNDAIDDTDSEFMVFLNPKTIISPSIVNEIINHLCSGFALSAPVSFGGFGTTKELFRNIGMFDERFIGGEFEDNDFMLRINLADLAFYHHYSGTDYKSTYSKRPLKRGSSKSMFDLKWDVSPPLNASSQIMFTHPDTPYKWSLNPKYNNHKTISKRHSLNNNSISSSWLPNSHSFKGSQLFCSKFFMGSVKEVVMGNKFPKSKLCTSKLIVNYDKTGDIKFEVKGNEYLFFNFVINHSKTTADLINWSIQSSNWRKINLKKKKGFKDLPCGEIQLRIYFQGDLIYTNFFPLNIDWEYKDTFTLPSIIKPSY